MTHSMKQSAFLVTLLGFSAQTMLASNPKKCIKDWAKKHSDALTYAAKMGTAFVVLTGGAKVIQDVATGDTNGTQDATSVATLAAGALSGYLFDKTPASWVEASIIYPLLIKGTQVLGATNECKRLLNASPLSKWSPIGDTVQRTCRSITHPMTFALITCAARDLHNRIWSRAEYAEQLKRRKYDFGG